MRDRTLSKINLKKKLTPAFSSKLRRQLQKTKRKDSSNITTALISSIGEGLIIVNEYGSIEHINQSALEILGFERHELERKWYPGVLQMYDKAGNPIPDTERPIMRALLTGRPVTETIHYKKGDGTIVPVAVTASPFLVGVKPRGAVVIFRDISRETQIERAKDEFVSIASHQLRTPLTAIRLFAELLRDSASAKLSKKEIGYIDKILFSSEKMIDLVTDFLNISRIELGRLEIRPEETDIQKLVEIRIQEVKPIAKASGVKLVYKKELGKPCIVSLDRDLMGQVVHNLLINAIRYSQPKNKAQVEIKLEKTSRSYRLTVADNGIGIPRTAQPRIFERFYRAENAIRNQPEGNGLGLYLIKQIVETAGGKITYKTQENEGTAFIVSIPIRGMTKVASTTD